MRQPPGPDISRSYEADWQSAVSQYGIPRSVTNIGSYAFQNSRLAGVTISNGVNNIGMGAFDSCTNLTSVTIPSSVSSIGLWAFNNCEWLTNVTISEGVTSINQGGFAACSTLPKITIPASVTNIGIEAFALCYSLSGIYFQGNAPATDGDPLFYESHMVVAYYLPGTTGWDVFAQDAEVAIAPWLPRILTSDGHFGPQPNGYSFNIDWASGQTVVVDGSTNLVNPEWQPLQTNTLIGTSVYFSDPQWMNYSSRFYRVRSPSTDQ